MDNLIEAIRLLTEARSIFVRLNKNLLACEADDLISEVNLQIKWDSFEENRYQAAHFTRRISGLVSPAIAGGKH